jgi:hypothetical protein
MRTFGVREVQLPGVPAITVGRDPEQAPWSASRIAANTRGESKRGQQYQSIVPSVPTRRDGVQIADQAVLGDRQIALPRRRVQRRRARSWPVYGTRTSFPFDAELWSISCACRASVSGRRSATTGWNQTRPSCQRGDSPNTIPSIRTSGALTTTSPSARYRDRPGPAPELLADSRSTANLAAGADLTAGRSPSSGPT